VPTLVVNKHTLTLEKEVPMAETIKVKGPASYFPSIEKTYAKPIAYWMDILERLGPLKHMALVNCLKAQHQVGHGHANALVAAFLATK
jgi:hypothetical protein